MDIFTKYGYAPDKEAISRSLDLIAGNLENAVSPEVLKTCFSIMDLTTLRSNDTAASVEALVDKVNALKVDFPEYPLPASICVYPNFAATVRARRNYPDVHVTTVASCFPSAQSFLEVKMRECELAVENGADEIDIVLALNSFLAEDYATAGAEIRAMRFLGADAVGMSTAPECIAARHCGMRILGVTLLSNMAAGILDKPLSGEEVIEAGNAASERLSGYVTEFLTAMD